MKILMQNKIHKYWTGHGTREASKEYANYLDLLDNIPIATNRKTIRSKQNQNKKNDSEKDNRPPKKLRTRTENTRGVLSKNQRFEDQTEASQTNETPIEHMLQYDPRADKYTMSLERKYEETITISGCVEPFPELEDL